MDMGVEKLSRAVSGSKGLIHKGADEELLCIEYCLIPKATRMAETPTKGMQKENRMLRTKTVLQ